MDTNCDIFTANSSFKKSQIDSSPKLMERDSSLFAFMTVSHDNI